MEFLYRLYSNDFFGIGLFIVITILAFSFLIILFFGRKDEKARNVEDKKLNNEVTNNMLNTDSLETVDLEPKVEPVIENMENNIKEEILDPALKEEPADSSEIERNYEPIVERSLTNNEKVEEELYIPPVQPVQEEYKEREFRYEPVREYSTVPVEEPVNVEESYLEDYVPKSNNDFIESFHIDTDKPVMEDERDNFSDTMAYRNLEPKRTVAMPKQFSSVYISKEPKEPVYKTREERIAEEEIAPIPLKQNMDMPKPFDLPKLNKQVGTSSPSNDNIIKTFNDSNDNFNDLFENIEDDTYTL